MADSQSILSSLYLPMIGKTLVLPNVSIAEIVDYQAPEPESKSPAWFLGHVTWRGVKLPVISYDRMNDGGIHDTDILKRLAVINTISEHHARLPFFAMVTQGIPRQVKIEKDIIKEMEGELGAADLMKVSVLGEEATIPNLEYIEKRIIERK